MIRITNLKEEHLDKRVALLNDKVVSNGIYISYPVSYSSTLNWFRTLKINNRHDFSVLSGENVIGFAGIVNVDRQNGGAEVYIFLEPNLHGKGLGTKTINILLSYCKIELGLRKITLYVSSNNKSVIDFYERIGFKIEGVLIKHVWFRGEYRDRYILSFFLDELTDLEPIYEVIE